MTAKLFSITLLAALTTAATAQTTTTKPSATTTKPSATATKPATTTHRTTSTATTTTTPPNIPKVVGVPKTVYALRYVDTLVGTGPLAEPSIIGTSQANSTLKWYTVKYTGWLTDGTKFDSSYDHPGGEPITFIAGAHRVITGWDTGFQGMHVGGKRRLFIPYQLAYGEAGRPPQIPPKSDLIFDIELVSISDKPPTPPTPPQPAAKPADPNAKPAEPTAKPTDPNAKPADPNAKPTDSNPKPADPAKPTDPNPKPATTPPPADPTKPETTPHPQSL
jgi:peptidylprolyl isomerase